MSWKGNTEVCGLDGEYSRIQLIDPKQKRKISIQQFMENVPYDFYCFDIVQNIVPKPTYRCALIAGSMITPFPTCICHFIFQPEDVMEEAYT